MDELTTKEKKKGRPSKRNKINWPVVKLMYERGFTDEEVSKVVGISRSNLSKWKQRNIELQDTIQGWKKKANEKVEKALFERATGYEHDDLYIAQHQGKIITKKIKKHYPPDTAAAFIWLKNRKSNKWRDKQEIESTVNNKSVGLDFSKISMDDIAQLSNLLSRVPKAEPELVKK
jgi:transcriptional regulator with XRE-family HTH domain